jgi:hypothetical protein
MWIFILLSTSVDFRRCPRCPTHAGVRHLYDTHTKHVGIVKEVSEKSNKFHQKNDFFFFASTLFKSMSDTHMTLIQHVSDNIFKQVFQKEFVFFYGSTFLIHFFVKSQTRLKMLNTYWNNIIDEELKTLILIKIFLIFLIINQ